MLENFFNRPNFVTQCIYNANLFLNLSLFATVSWEFLENIGNGPVPFGAAQYLMLLTVGSFIGREGARKKVKFYILVTTFFWIYDIYVSWKVLAHPISKGLHGKRFLKGIHLVKLFPNSFLILYGLSKLSKDFNSWLEWERQDQDKSNGKLSFSTTF